MSENASEKTGEAPRYPDGTNYALSYFRTEAEALHLAFSEDGVNWNAANDNKPILTGTVGCKTLRDPFVFADNHGLYHLLATNGWRSDSIVHAVSENLTDWGEQKLLPVMASQPNVRNCWAPECFFDAEAGLYRLIWSSSLTEPNGAADWNHRIWSASTEDFSAFSPAQLFFDPGYSVIDATVIAWRGGYLMAFKDERGENEPSTAFKAIRVCFAESGAGPYREISELITPPLTEGPTLFQRGAELVLLFDHFMENKFGAVHSTDSKNWSPLNETLRLPSGVRHANVITLSK